MLAVLAIPLILWGLFTGLTSALGGPKLRTFSPSTGWTIVGVVVLLTFWIVRNLPYAPFHWLYSGTLTRTRIDPGVGRGRFERSV